MQLDAAPIMKMNTIPEGSTSALRVYPNPASRKFTVEYQSAVAGEAQMRLFDASGKVIHEQDVKVKSGTNSYEVMLKSQPASSTYILQMVQGDEVNTRKIVISDK
jgi:putative heme degradation protein